MSQNELRLNTEEQRVPACVSFRSSALLTVFLLQNREQANCAQNRVYSGGVRKPGSTCHSWIVNDAPTASLKSAIFFERSSVRQLQPLPTMIVAADLRWLSAMVLLYQPPRPALSGSLLHSSLGSWTRLRVLKVALTKLPLQAAHLQKNTAGVPWCVKFHFRHVLLSQ